MMHNLNRRKFLQQAAANAAAAIVLPSLHLDRFNNQSYQYLGRITGRALIVKTNQVSGESIIGWANGSTVVNGIQLADNLHLITPPHWTQIGPSFWYQWQAYIYSVTAINTGTTDTVTTFGSLSGSSKWFGGVLAPNGMIYGIPYNSTSVLKIRPRHGYRHYLWQSQRDEQLAWWGLSTKRDDLWYSVRFCIRT